MCDPAGIVEFVYSDKSCVICNSSFDTSVCGGSSCKRVKAGLRGIEGLKQYSVLHCDEQLAKYLESGPEAIFYHSECYKSITNDRLLLQKRHSDTRLETVVPSKSLRSASAGFCWKEHCFLCAAPIITDTRTLEIRNTILDACQNRQDSWSMQIWGRLEACIDLVAEEAVYHKQCYVNFITGRSIPKDNNVQIPKSVDEKKMAAFEALCAWMENSSELNSISELHEVMAELAGHDEDVYSEKHLQRLLLKKYEGEVVLTQVAGRANVVCFTNNASKV